MCDGLMADLLPGTFIAFWRCPGMPGQLRVEFVSLQITGELLCSLCDKPFVPPPRVPVLFQGAFPVGHVCGDCFSNPGRAATRARRYAEHIRNMARAAQGHVPETECLMIFQLADARSKHWETLADLIEQFDDWKAAEFGPPAASAS